LGYADTVETGRRKMKGQQKPKQLAKKAPQKTLKEQRAAKKAKKKDY
jgi:hypothetical protein